MGNESGGTREYTLEEALEVAFFLQKEWKLEEAAEAYRRILEVWPDHPDVLLRAGVLAYQRDSSEEALALMERALAIAPDRADIHNNRGIVLKALGRGDEATADYRRAIDLDPGHANAYSNLGLLLRDRGKPAEAEEAYRQAIRLDPGHVGAYLNLAMLLDGLGRDQESFECLCRATTLQPKHHTARRLLAMAYCTLGQPDQATKIYRVWAEEEPDDPVPRHLLAACTGEDVPARASDAFVEKTFDDFASTFDVKLAHLSYRAPQIVAAMMADSGRQPAKNLDVLDAGCGTGLCGPLFAPYARRLIGVDLSRGMLAGAQKRGVYDELVKGELTEYLQAHESSFDVIVSADTLCYFGALEEAIGAAAAALRPRGSFVLHAGSSHRRRDHCRLPSQHARPLLSHAGVRGAAAGRGRAGVRARARPTEDGVAGAGRWAGGPGHKARVRAGGRGRDGRSGYGACDRARPSVSLMLSLNATFAYGLPPTASRKTGNESMRQDVAFTSLPVAWKSRNGFA